MTSSNTNSPSNLRVQIILWAALTFSILIYGFIGSIVKPAKEPDPKTIQTLIYLFGALSFSEALVIFVVIPRQTTMHLFTSRVLRWVLSDSIAIYGFVLLLLGGDPNIAYIFLGCGLFFMLILFPKKPEKRNLSANHP